MQHRRVLSKTAQMLGRKAHKKLKKFALFDLEPLGY